MCGGNILGGFSVFLRAGKLPGTYCGAVLWLRCELWGWERCLGAGSHLGKAGPFPGGLRAALAMMRGCIKACWLWARTEAGDGSR